MAARLGKRERPFDSLRTSRRRNPVRQSNCRDSSGPASPAASQPTSRPLSHRVSKTRWEKALQMVARSTGLAQECTSVTLAVARVLAGYMSATGGQCFPGLLTLARELRMKPKTVAKHRDLLEALGFLEVNRGGGRGRRTEYYATLPVTLAGQPVKRPARARAQRALPPRPPLELAGDVGPGAQRDGEGLQPA